jgi:hypothetical protein
MSDVRKALIWGIENPPREYTIEEWFIVSEFARHVAEHSKESLRQEVIKKLKSSNPCVVTDTEFGENMKKEYEQIQRGMKEFAKGKIGRFGEVPPSISIEDIKDCVECNLDYKCNECKYRDCEISSYPCDECEKSSKFEKRKTK